VFQTYQVLPIHFRIMRSFSHGGHDRGTGLTDVYDLQSGHGHEV